MGINLLFVHACPIHIFLHVACTFCFVLSNTSMLRTYIFLSRKIDTSPGFSTKSKKEESQIDWSCSKVYMQREVAFEPSSNRRFSSTNLIAKSKSFLSELSGRSPTGIYIRMARITKASLQVFNERKKLESDAIDLSCLSRLFLPWKDVPLRFSRGTSIEISLIPRTPSRWKQMGVCRARDAGVN